MAAAIDLFTTRGYGATSLADLAEAAGVSKSAVAFHIKSKADLAAELSEGLIDDLERLVDRPAPVGWPEEARFVFGAYVDRLAMDLPLAVWLDGDVTIPGEIRDRLLATIGRLAELLTGPERDSGARVRALAAVGGLWRPVRMLDVDQLTAHRQELIDSALISFAPLVVEPRTGA